MKLMYDGDDLIFLRALNNGDLSDLDRKIIVDSFDNIRFIRSDRERFCEENVDVKYNDGSTFSFEELIDHVKVDHRYDTNCISISCDPRVSIHYGRDFYRDLYVYIRLDKSVYEEKVINAGEYILYKILECVNSFEISDLDRRIFERIDECDDVREMNIIIFGISKFSGRRIKVCKKNNSYKRNSIRRFVYFRTLDSLQNLMVNKVLAKLYYLEKKYGGKIRICEFCNNDLIVQTLERAYLSCEYIFYGRIDGKFVSWIDGKDIDKMAEDMIEC